MAGRHFDTAAEAYAHLEREGFVAERTADYTHVFRATDDEGDYTLRAIVIPHAGVSLLIMDVER